MNCQLRTMLIYAGTATLLMAPGRGSGRKPVTGRGFSIREYGTADFSAVIRLWRLSCIHTGLSDSKRELERARKRDPELFLVADSQGIVAGAVFGRFDGRRGWINHLAVHPSFRSRGIGEALVRELEKRLAAAGCAKVNLHVHRSNEGVCAFYDRLGYGRADLIYMGKWLRRRPARQ